MEIKQFLIFDYTQTVFQKPNLTHNNPTPPQSHPPWQTKTTPSPTHGPANE